MINCINHEIHYIPKCAFSHCAPEALLAACYAVLSGRPATKVGHKEDETLRARYAAPPPSVPVRTTVQMHKYFAEFGELKTPWKLQYKTNG